jgi:hypothetical protein
MEDVGAPIVQPPFCFDFYRQRTYIFRIVLISTPHLSTYFAVNQYIQNLEN